MPTFKVQGQVYHLLGSFLPANKEEPKFLQIYFLSDEKSDVRCKTNPVLNPTIVKDLQIILHQNNKYIKSFKTAIECQPTDNFSVVIQADTKSANAHKGRFKAPTVNEVAVLIDGQNFEKRDIVLKTRDSRLQRIAETHRAYDSLQYPLLFLKGEDGYNFFLKQADGNKKISAMNFYAYRVMIRKNEFNGIYITSDNFLISSW